MTSDEGGPMMDMVLEEIGRDECLDLLEGQSIGRLAVADHGYYPPHIVPVNFVLDGDNVLFRSDAGLKFKLSILAEHSVSFEADDVHSGGPLSWSVVVQGRADLLAEDEAAALEHLSWLHPLAPGDRAQLVRIVPYTITGRRLRAVPHVAANGQR
jgi:nitroimidazol reductase NimA-like FMN-containing flavoprotein (pyridoxamine 5'-phosphate oxidase superfamily)